MACLPTYKGVRYNNVGALKSFIAQERSGLRPVQKTTSPIIKPTEVTNHSGGAYGADTLFDTIGREFGVTKHNHYRDSKNTNLSKNLRDTGVRATVLTDAQMETARGELERLLGKKYPDTIQGNLQVRNYFQVANADSVFAVSTLKEDRSGVTGGTNTAVQLGIKMNKPTYVWDINSESWYVYDGNIFIQTETPTLTKDFAGVGTRDVENYSKPLSKDASGKVTKWGNNTNYLGDNKANAAKNAIREVYSKTFSTENLQETQKTTPNTISQTGETLGKNTFNMSPKQSLSVFDSPSDVRYQNSTGRALNEYVATEKTIRDLASTLSDRIGIPVRFENNKDANYKGKLDNSFGKSTAVINLAHATLDTPVHEIFAHPVIRTIKGKNKGFASIGSIVEDSKGNQFKIENITEDYDFMLEGGEIVSSSDYKLKDSENSELYNNLLTELESGLGKEIFDRIQRDYVDKEYNPKKVDYTLSQLLSEVALERGIAENNVEVNLTTGEEKNTGLIHIKPGTTMKYGEKEYIYGEVENATFYTQEWQEITSEKYSIEEQQEEALVELLGLYTAGKIDAKNNGSLISLLKNLLQQIGDYVKSLITSREVDVSKLSDNMTLNDLANLFAYSNSKLILPNYEVVYTTRDGQTFKTYAEASNHTGKLIKDIQEINLDEITVFKDLDRRTKRKLDRLIREKESLETERESAKFKKNKTKEIDKIQKKIDKIQSKPAELYDQEPTLTREDANIYGLEDFTYVRLESVYSRPTLYNKDDYGYDSYKEHRDVLGDNYKGYYIHGYNTERGKPSTKIVPITKEQAIEIFNKDKSYPTEIKRELDNLENDKYNIESDVDIRSKIRNVEYSIKEIQDGPLQQFIDQNLEYAKNEASIENWKKDNNIEYNPQEVYSRGEGFYSVSGAYANFDLNLLLQNLLQHLEDGNKVGEPFVLSVFTRPVDGQSSLELKGGNVRYTIFPESQHIKWAAPRDVYSGSTQDASYKVAPNSLKETVGVSYTKSPIEYNFNAISPNLVEVIENRRKDNYNELGVEITPTNFRLEYDDNIPSSTKKIIDNFNKILDDKYGELVKPEVSTEVVEPTVTRETLNSTLEEISTKTKIDEIQKTKKALANMKIAALKEAGGQHTYRSLIDSKVQPIQNNNNQDTMFDIEDLPFQKVPSAKQVVETKLQMEKQFSPDFSTFTELKQDIFLNCK